MRRLRDFAKWGAVSAGVLALALAAAACSQTPSQEQGASGPAPGGLCDPNTAQFLIGDGFQEIMCGCQEASGQPVTAGSGSVTCTVSAGKVIFFYYLGTQLKHSIVPSDGTSFPASPISDPTDDNPFRTYAFTLSTPGSYGYLDAFDVGVSGTIVVQ